MFRTLMSTGFAPSGITDDEEIRTASSITDYICRRLAIDYLSFDDRLELGLASLDDMPEQQTTLLTDDRSLTGQLIEVEERSAELKGITSDQTILINSIMPVTNNVKENTEITNFSSQKITKTIPKDNSAPLCNNCGNQTQRSGSCYVCMACGSTTGCS